MGLCVCPMLSRLSDSLGPMDCSPPGFSTHGILQARILEWVAISFSRGSSPPGDRIWVSHIAGRLLTVWATREAWVITSCITGGFFTAKPLGKPDLQCIQQMSMAYLPSRLANTHYNWPNFHSPLLAPTSHQIMKRTGERAEQWALALRGMRCWE